MRPVFSGWARPRQTSDSYGSSVANMSEVSVQPNHQFHDLSQKYQDLQNLYQHDQRNHAHAMLELQQKISEQQARISQLEQEISQYDQYCATNALDNEAINIVEQIWTLMNSYQEPQPLFQETQTNDSSTYSSQPCKQPSFPQHFYNDQLSGIEEIIDGIQHL